jgi:signal transduction histidine kinase
MSNLSDKELLGELQKRFEQNNQYLSELRDLNKKLEDSEALKSHFISNITNEIINPFASILALSENILKIENKDGNRVGSFAKMIYEEAFELNFQLKNIFAAAKLEAGEYIPVVNKVNICEVLKEIKEFYANKLSEKEIELNIVNNISENCYFNTDSDKLKVAISNLINNGIQFAGDSKSIILSASIKNENLILSVRDFGIGIDKNYNDKIFDRFYRLNNEINSINKGLGLGLSVAKGIITLFDGTIEVNNLEDGSEFIVTVPEDKSSEIMDTINKDDFMLDNDSEMF